FELLSPTPIAADDELLRQALSVQSLAADLLAGINFREIARSQFAVLPRIPGLVFQGFPGRGKTTRQIQASSGLIFDVLTQYDPDNLLLDQSRLEVLEAQLEIT